MVRATEGFASLSVVTKYFAKSYLKLLKFAYNLLVEGLLKAVGLPDLRLGPSHTASTLDDLAIFWSK
jgi:hypothetical protein